MQYIELNNEQMQKLYSDASLDVEEEGWSLHVGEYVIFQYRGENQKAYQYNGKSIKEVPLHILGEKSDKFSPLNLEQRCYFDLLQSNDTPIKICSGIAGSGKTKAALKFGFHKLKKGEVQKIFLVREPVGLGEKVGYFKGDKDDKILKWNSPIKDNLEGDSQLSLEELIAQGAVEVDIPLTMLGRDLKNCWIIVDESQNLTRQQFKMIGERVAVNSQIVFIGDLNQTVNGKFREDSGLSRAFTLEGKSALLGFVKLKEDVRSEVSKFFATQF